MPLSAMRPWRNCFRLHLLAVGIGILHACPFLRRHCAARSWWQLISLPAASAQTGTNYKLAGFGRRNVQAALALRGAHAFKAASAIDRDHDIQQH